jgi:hypothetical protein
MLGEKRPALREHRPAIGRHRENRSAIHREETDLQFVDPERDTDLQFFETERTELVFRRKTDQQNVETEIEKTEEETDLQIVQTERTGRRKIVRCLVSRVAFPVGDRRGSPRMLGEKRPAFRRNREKKERADLPFVRVLEEGAEERERESGREREAERAQTCNW